MPIIRKRLRPSDVYPEDVRYNETTDTFQSLVDGEWVDNPEGDPRHKTVYPPRVTADTACDAAESVKDALKNQIDAILLAIDNGATAFAIAGTVLSIFSFGVFGVFIGLALALADAMLGAGTTAIEAALDDPAWDEFKCLLYCRMNSSGRLSAAGMDGLQSDIAANIGGLGATILNAMLNISGEGGVNNLASLGASTGDCSGCGCDEEWCYTFDFTLTSGGAFVSAAYGTYSPGVGWQGVPYGTGGGINNLQFNFDTAQLSGMSSVHSASGFGGYQKLALWFNLPGGAVAHSLVSDPETMNGTDIDSFYDSFDDMNLANQVQLYFDGAGSSDVTIQSVAFWGTGTNPFGANNCTSP